MLLLSSVYVAAGSLEEDMLRNHCLRTLVWTKKLQAIWCGATLQGGQQWTVMHGKHS